MSDTVIKLENVSKQYRLGNVDTFSIHGDIKRWLARLRGKDDPFLQVGQENILDKISKDRNGEYVWALKDINLEVKEGEVLGIIGKNGAGKSTLLKLMSRVTAPTTGNIKIKGRIASLLEVGTGFHPELTGKENIYLNGAILGMTKSEIKSKFDEIVDFSGVEKYIDTPVKRYSSGMYVRLAFAVAAHLDPEILIVDEVLAVGDAEFQKKAIGKMEDVSHNQGRTVLFVSHNMTAISALCSRSILLTNGKIISDGLSIDIVKQYLTPKIENAVLSDFRLPKMGREIRFEKIELIGGSNIIEYYQPITVEFILKSYSNRNIDNLTFGFGLKDSYGTNIFMSYSEIPYTIVSFSSKSIRLTIQKTKHLMPGKYLTVLAVFEGPALEGELMDLIERYHSIEIIGNQYPVGYGFAYKWRQGWGSLLLDQIIEEIKLS